MPADPAFRFWLRRDGDQGTTWSVRFEVSEGRGLVRLARPGLSLDPPPRRSAQERGLLAPQLRAGAFVHVLGGHRTPYLLAGLEDDTLGRVHDEEWRLLDVVAGPGEPLLVLQPDEDLPPTEIHRLADLGLPPPLRLERGRRPPVVPAERTPALVRHLRRELTRLRLENEALRARLARLEPPPTGEEG